MTWRDPNNTDFVRKNIELYDCVNSYFRISDEVKMRQDLNRSDINLVCFHEIKTLRDHARQTHGLNYNDLVKLTPQQEREFLAKIAQN
jgi:hypothetical protein